MARIRTIKPEFWTSEQVVECSPTSRLLFIGLWNFADDGGIIPSSPKSIKMKIFPGDDFTAIDIDNMLDELVNNNLVERYTVDDKEYLQITGWHHQKIEKPTLRYPAKPKKPKFDDHSTTPRRPFDDSSPPEGKGREGNGKDDNPPCIPPPCETPSAQESASPPTATEPPTDPKPKRETRATRLTEDWRLPDEWLEWAEAERPEMNIPLLGEMFYDYWIAQGGQKGAKKDWLATWRNWVRNQQAKPQLLRVNHNNHAGSNLKAVGGIGFSGRVL